MDGYLGADDDLAAGFAPWLGQGDDDAAFHLDGLPTKDQAEGDGQPDFFDLESMLNLPSPTTAFGHASFYAGSSSPESSGGSSSAQPAESAAFDFGPEVSWEGILERPIFPQQQPQQVTMPPPTAHSPFASSASVSASSVSQTFSPPTAAFVTFDNSPVYAGGLLPPQPTSVPAGGFPPGVQSPSISSTSPSVAGSSHSLYGGPIPTGAQPPQQQQQQEVKRGPAVPPNPELERLLASMRAYNSTYGARLPVLGSPATSASTYEASVTVMADQPFAPAAPAAVVARPVTAKRASSSSPSSSFSGNSAAAAVAFHTDGRSYAPQRDQRPSSEDASDGMVDSEDDDDDEHRPMRAISVDHQSAPAGEGLKHTSSGRRGRNGAGSSSKAAAKRVAGGGLMSSVVVEAEDERGEGEEWRPTPEEYAKLDSKQKRQLRNKISAKNFRNRRKDYVDRLEGHLSERDRLLAFAREEMRRKERENDELRREMAVLRNAVSMFNQTSFSANAFGPGAATPAPSASTSVADDDSFWSAPAPSFALNPTIQTVSLPPPTKPDPLPSTATQMNLNPLLQPGTLRPQASPTTMTAAGTFEHFADATPFSVRQATVDQYRSQLWARLAREAAYAGVATTAADDEMRAKQLSLKPLFFAHPAAEQKTFGPSLATSGGRLGGGLPLPVGPSATALIASHVAAERAESDEASAHLALLATVTQQTITTKLTSAFLDAFVAPSPMLGPNSTKQQRQQQAVVLDADKMASVLSGKARLEVVPVEQDAAPVKRECASVTLERALAALSLSFGGACKNRHQQQQQRAAAAAAAAMAPATTADVQAKKATPPTISGWRDFLCPKKALSATTA